LTFTDRRLRWSAAIALSGHAVVIALIASSGRVERTNRVSRQVEVFTTYVLQAQTSPLGPTVNEGQGAATSENDKAARVEPVVAPSLVQREQQHQRGVASTRYPVAALGPSDNSAPSEAAVSETATVADAATGQDGGETRIHAPLTREQLGLGQGEFAVEQRSPLLRDADRRLAQSRKLDRSLLQDATEHARKLGLGPSGPILAELERQVQSSALDANGWATVHARLLDSGKLELELLGSSSNRDGWKRLLALAQQRIATQRLLPPKGSRGLDLEIRVESRIQLPSGHDPGFGVNLFGLTLKKGKGERSSKFEALSSLPHIDYDIDETYANGERKPPRLVLDLFKLSGDPADIGAVSRRIVSARVLRQTVL